MNKSFSKFNFIFIAVLISLLFGICHADILTFKWDNNTEPDLAGYRLFRREEGTTDYGDTVLDNISADANTCIYSLPETQVTNYFVLRAFDEDNNESGNSNEVSYTPPDITPPSNPSGFELINVFVM